MFWLFYQSTFSYSQAKYFVALKLKTSTFN